MLTRIRQDFEKFSTRFLENRQQLPENSGPDIRKKTPKKGRIFHFRPVRHFRPVFDQSTIFDQFSPSPPYSISTPFSTTSRIKSTFYFFQSTFFYFSPAGVFCFHYLIYRKKPSPLPTQKKIVICYYNYFVFSFFLFRGTFFF